MTRKAHLPAKYPLINRGKSFYLNENQDRQRMLKEGTEQIMQSLAELLPEEYRGKYRG